MWNLGFCLRLNTTYGDAQQIAVKYATPSTGTTSAGPSNAGATMGGTGSSIPGIVIGVYMTDGDAWSAWVNVITTEDTDKNFSHSWGIEVL